MSTRWSVVDTRKYKATRFGRTAAPPKPTGIPIIYDFGIARNALITTGFQRFFAHHFLKVFGIAADKAKLPVAATERSLMGRSNGRAVALAHEHRW